MDFESTPILPPWLTEDGPATPRLAQVYQGLDTAATTETRTIAPATASKSLQITADPAQVLAFFTGRRGAALPFLKPQEEVSSELLAALEDQSVALLVIKNNNTHMRALRTTITDTTTPASLAAEAALTAGERLVLLQLCRFATDTLDIPAAANPATFTLEIKEL